MLEGKAVGPENEYDDEFEYEDAPPSRPLSPAPAGRSLVPMAKIVLVDDELTMVQMVAEVLQGDGHEVFPFTSFNGVPEAIEQRRPDLVITDLFLDRTRPQGLEIIRKARALQPPAAVIMITGFGTVDSAVEAMRLGAHDYLEKPFKLDDLRLSVERALNYTRTVAENVLLRQGLQERYGFSRIIGASEPMQAVFRVVERVAASDATVLILGESGTGKELVARAVHHGSRRAHAPFIPVNCSALPENLLESELFGHRKGAFTGAVADKDGLFHEADGGTLFLDEIGTMPATLQSRLLRVLQEHEVRRVGDNTPTRVDVRMVAATNEDLEALVKDGRFREDLFYRLNVVPVCLPPLRDRAGDIPLLVAHFLRDRVHARTGQPFRISRRAVAALAAHPWPGNVRELENVIERAVVLADTPFISVADLPPAVQQAAPAADGDEEADPADLGAVASPTVAAEVASGDGEPSGVGLDVGMEGLPSQAGQVVSLKRFLRDQEGAYLRRVLRLTHQNKEEAARLLDISQATLYRRIAEHGG